MQIPIDPRWREIDQVLASLKDKDQRWLERANKLLDTEQPASPRRIRWGAKRINRDVIGDAQ